MRVHRRASSAAGSGSARTAAIAVGRSPSPVHEAVAGVTGAAELRASATVASSASWAVTVLVAGTARSGPASVRSRTSTVPASSLPGSFVIPTTTAPASFIARQVLLISGVAPDWLSTTTKYPRQSTSARYRV